MEHPDIVNAQPILRPTQSSQPFDATATRFLRLVPQMRCESTSHRHPNVRRQPPEVFDGFGGENDGKRHSGYNIARLSLIVKPATAARQERVDLRFLRLLYRQGNPYSSDPGDDSHYHPLRDEPAAADGNLYPPNSKLGPLPPDLKDEDFEEFVEVPRDVYYDPTVPGLLVIRVKKRNDRLTAGSYLFSRIRRLASRITPAPAANCAAVAH
jgi:hypothetical protein